MIIPHDKRLAFWNFLITEKVKKPKGVTPRRLAIIEKDVLVDDNFWFQVISRFGVELMSPEEVFLIERRSRADFVRSQFWAMCSDKINDRY